MSQTSGGLTDMQAGRLLADVEHLREAMAQQGLLLKEISDKLDDRVTRDEFEQYKKEHVKDVKENYVSREEIAGLVRLWGFLTTDFMKLLSKVILWGVVIALTFNMLRYLPPWMSKATADKVIHEAKEE